MGCFCTRIDGIDDFMMRLQHRNPSLAVSGTAKAGMTCLVTRSAFPHLAVPGPRYKLCATLQMPDPNVLNGHARHVQPLTCHIVPSKTTQKPPTRHFRGSADQKPFRPTDRPYLCRRLVPDSAVPAAWKPGRTGPNPARNDPPPHPAPACTSPPVPATATGPPSTYGPRMIPATAFAQTRRFGAPGPHPAGLSCLVIRPVHILSYLPCHLV